MNITIIGAGYVGLTTAAILANCGKYTVHVIDTDERKIKTIQSGKSYFYEEGLDSLISTAINAERMIVNSDYSSAFDDVEIVFSCVGTPDNPDGSSNLTYIYEAAKEASKYMNRECIYVQKSTVPVGTGDSVSKLLNGISYASNPEFLREGSALIDTLWFDRLVVGTSDTLVKEKIFSVYKTILNNRDHIVAIAGINPPTYQVKEEFIGTSLRSAELIKVTANAFLALKISFANSIALLSDKVGADINEVLSAVGSDRRIGKEFFNAGRGYGGGCFPKDVSGLILSAREYGVDLSIMNETANINASMPGYIVNKLKEALDDLPGKQIAILGLSFKPGTSDTRKSPAVAIANILSERGASVTVYDPVSNFEAKPDLHNNIIICDSIEDCIKSTDAVCVATSWQEFIKYDLLKMKQIMKGDTLVDTMNAYDKETVKGTGLRYIGVGR
jgi:UDPglucose 6-dehydrogenase